jgi:hypothetical protein
VAPSELSSYLGVFGTSSSFFVRGLITMAIPRCRRINDEYPLNMTSDYRFSGHESFPLRYAWLSKAYRRVAANQRPWTDVGDAMVELGVGKNMVTAVRFWAEAAHVIDQSPGGESVITPFGAAVFGDDGLDPFLDDIATLWLVHWNITSVATPPLHAWNVFFSHWIDPDFSRTRAIGELERRAVASGRVISKTTIAQHFDVFLHTYVPPRARRVSVAEETLDSPLTELELIRHTASQHISGDVELIYNFSREHRPSLSTNVVAYCLADYWRRHRPNEATLTFADVATARAGIGQVFRLPESDIREHLDRLEESSAGQLIYSHSAGIPVVRRSGPLAPMTLLRRIYATKDSVEIELQPQSQQPARIAKQIRTLRFSQRRPPLSKR